MKKVEVWPNYIIETVAGEIREVTYFSVGDFKARSTIRNFWSEKDARHYADMHNSKLETFGRLFV